MNLKIGVVGGRDITDKEYIFNVLKLCIHKNDTIISGGCYGVDSYAEQYADSNHIELIMFPPLDEDGEKKFHERNKRIVLESDLIIAFPSKNSKGTWDTVKLAKDNHKRIIIINNFL